jgi:hypothetical protein
VIDKKKDNITMIENEIENEKHYKNARTQLKYDLLKQVDELKIENEESRKINAKLKKEINHKKNQVQKQFASRLQQVYNEFYTAIDISDRQNSMNNETDDSMNYNQSLENDCVLNQHETVSAPSSVSNKPNMYSMPQGSFIDNEFNYSNRNLTNSSSDLLSPNMTENLSVNENSFSSYLSDSASTSNSCLLDSNQSSVSNMSPIRQSLSVQASTINIYDATNDHRNFSDIESVSVRNNANCFAINSKKSLKRCSKKKSKSIENVKHYKNNRTQLKYDLLKQVHELKIENEESRKVNAKLKKEINYIKNLLQVQFASRLQQ